jgi:hypothetical protein
MVLPPHINRLIYMGLISEKPELPECSICYDKLKIETFYSTTCGHFFCQLCLMKINKCAVCRRKIDREHWHPDVPYISLMYSNVTLTFFERRAPEYAPVSERIITQWSNTLEWLPQDVDSNVHSNLHLSPYSDVYEGPLSYWHPTPRFNLGVLRTSCGVWHSIYVNSGVLSYNGQPIVFAPLEQIIVNPDQLAITSVVDGNDRPDD